MTKPAELVEPDPRWQSILGTRDDLAATARDWPTSALTPVGIAEMLRVARDLFVHSYFVYEFGVVAVTWSLVAIEAALRDCLGSDAAERDGLGKLIGKAQGRGWLSSHEGDALRAGAELRGRLTHAQGQMNFTVGMTGPMLRVAHETVSNLYNRQGPTSAA